MRQKLVKVPVRFVCLFSFPIHLRTTGQGSPSFCFVHITFSLILSAHHTSSNTPLMTRNPGDRHGVFHFQVPSKFLGAVLGPETYAWLVRRYGQATVDRSGIYRARILQCLFLGLSVSFSQILHDNPEAGRGGEWQSKGGRGKTAGGTSVCVS